jgi:hypothetical protein
MTPELAKAALAFLERTSLAPREIAAYVEVVRALQALTVPKPKKTKAPA